VTSPKDVIREALLQPVPCPTCTDTKPCWCALNRAARLEWQVDAIANALMAADLLVSSQPASAPTESDMAEVARFLAQESRFVRYYDAADPEDAGWKALLTSRADVELAYSKAKARNEGAARETTEALAQAQRLLLDHIESRRAAGGEA
jgi:hypothetical protein